MVVEFHRDKPQRRASTRQTSISETSVYRLSSLVLVGLTDTCPASDFQEATRIKWPRTAYEAEQAQRTNQRRFLDMLEVCLQACKAKAAKPCWLLPLPRLCTRESMMDATSVFATD